MTTTTDDAYDLESVWQLLAESCDLPDTEQELLKVLTEYRKALHSLATHVQAAQRPAEHDER